MSAGIDTQMVWDYALLNEISIDGHLLSALIDPAYTPAEVYQYWLEVAGAFPYLKNDLHLSWEEGIALIKDRNAIQGPAPEVKKSGDAEILDACFGLPLYRPGKLEAEEWIGAFMTPEQTPAFPITLGLTRNIVLESPYFILSLDITPGTWGYRHRQYEAIGKVYHSLEKEFSDVRTRDLEVWETQEVDFPRIRRELWLAAVELLTRFSKEKPVILREVKSIDTMDIPDYAADTFEHAVWMDQFDWWNDNANCQRAIAYWVARKNTTEWDRLFTACMRGVKGTWPGLVKILQHPPVSPADMDRLVSFLQDLNWPGAGEAYSFLQKQGEAAYPYLDKAIEEATRTNDESWLDWLKSARGIDTEE